MQAYAKTSVTDVDNAWTVLQDCISPVNCWCMSCRLQLNGSKTELIWHGSKASLAKLYTNKLDLEDGADIIHPISSVRNLGSELSMSNHIPKVSSTCFFQL